MGLEGFGVVLMRYALRIDFGRFCCVLLVLNG